MRVLLVEDEDHKIADIRRLLIDRFGNNLILASTRGVRDSVNAVYKYEFDLIVLDMAMPTFSEKGVGGGIQQAVGGIEVIRALHVVGKSAQIVIITQYPDIILNGETIPLKEVVSKISKQYKVKVIASILYSYKASEWEDSFKEALRVVK